MSKLKFTPKIKSRVLGLHQADDRSCAQLLPHRSAAARLIGPILTLGLFTQACISGPPWLPPVPLTPQRPIVKFQGVTYQACLPASPGPGGAVVPCDAPSLAPLRQGDLGAEQFRLAKTVVSGTRDFHNQLADGSGRGVNPGTSFYAVNGNDPERLLVAWMNGNWVPFWRHSVSDVARGRDVLDIDEGRVRYAAIRRRAESTYAYENVDGYLLSSEDIKAFAHSVESAPIDHQAQAASAPYEVELLGDEWRHSVRVWGDPGIVLHDAASPRPPVWSAEPIYVAIQLPNAAINLLESAILERAAALKELPTVKSFFHDPSIIAFDDVGRAWVADRIHSAVYRLLPDLQLDHNLEDGRAAMGLAIAPGGDIWTANGRIIKRFSSEGVLKWQIQVEGAVGFQEVAIDPHGDIWVTGNVLHKLAPDGAILRTYVLGEYQSGYDTEWHIAFDQRGHAWVTDSRSDVVHKFSPAMALEAKFPVGKHPRGIAFDRVGHAWVANSRSGSISKLSEDGEVLGTFAAGMTPHGVAVDAQGQIWVTDTATSGINHFRSDGTLIRRYWTHDGPTRLAIDAKGYIWVSNSLHGSVSRFLPNERVTRPEM